MGFGGSKAKPGEASNSFQQLIHLDMPPLSRTTQRPEVEVVLIAIPEITSGDICNYPSNIQEVLVMCRAVTKSEEEARVIFHLVNTYVATQIVETSEVEEYTQLLDGMV